LESIREKTKESGFSLMEAMVVLALLGLLAAFAGLSMAWTRAPSKKSAPTRPPTACLQPWKRQERSSASTAGMSFFPGRRTVLVQS
jgi:prepilin-type N-terminal cleavage/methylation domain-containing protein